MQFISIMMFKNYLFHHEQKYPQNLKIMSRQTARHFHIQPLSQSIVLSQVRFFVTYIQQINRLSLSAHRCRQSLITCLFCDSFYETKLRQNKNNKNLVIWVVAFVRITFIRHLICSIDILLHLYTALPFFLVFFALYINFLKLPNKSKSHFIESEAPRYSISLIFLNSAFVLILYSHNHVWYSLKLLPHQTNTGQFPVLSILNVIKEVKAT